MRTLQLTAAEDGLYLTFSERSQFGSARLVGDTWLSFVEPNWENSISLANVDHTRLLFSQDMAYCMAFSVDFIHFSAFTQDLKEQSWESDIGVWCLANAVDVCESEQGRIQLHQYGCDNDVHSVIIRFFENPDSL